MKSKIIKVLKFIGIIFSSLSVVTSAIVGIVSAINTNQIPNSTSSCDETEQVTLLSEYFERS